MFQVWTSRRVPEPLQPAFEGWAETFAGEDSEDQLSRFPEAHAAVVGGEYMTAELMDRCPKLLTIARTGVGYDRVDIPAATARNIAVTITPGAPTTSTAEHALMLLMATTKKLKDAEHKLRTTKGQDLYKQHTGIELDKKTLGVVGFGRIGRHVAKVAKALGMDILAYDPFLNAEAAQGMGARTATDLNSLLAEADVVTLHLPATAETTKMINRESLAAMKPGAFLINASRGELVDEAALLEALDSGRLAGAGLDVTDPEPPSHDNPLLHRNDVIVTPHIASSTMAGKLRIYSDAVDNVVSVLKGEQPVDLLNPEVWPRVVERLAAIR